MANKPNVRRGSGPVYYSWKPLPFQKTGNNNLQKTVKCDNKNLTIYQKLYYLFGQNQKIQKSTPKYSFGDGDLITTQSKEDYTKQKLELQQQHYLEAQWQRVDNENIIQQTQVYYRRRKCSTKRNQWNI